jgi:hypothetical protein
MLLALAALLALVAVPSAVAPTSCSEVAVLVRSRKSNKISTQAPVSADHNVRRIMPARVIQQDDQVF